MLEKQLPPFRSAPIPAQLEQSEAKCEDALKTQKVLTADLESMHSELENVTRSKSLVLSFPQPQKHRLEAWCQPARGTALYGTKTLTGDLWGGPLEAPLNPLGVQASLVDLLGAQLYKKNGNLQWTD